MTGIPKEVWLDPDNVPDHSEHLGAFVKYVPSMRVKPLVWESNGSRENSVWSLVESIDRSYTIEPIRHSFHGLRYHVETQVFPGSEYDSPTDLGEHSGFEYAKSVAQADFDRRIKSTIF